MKNYKPEKNRDEIVARIFYQKENNSRPKPSRNLILKESNLSNDIRNKLLDMIAEIVDSNCYGRSDMCVYFAILLKDALKTMGLPAKVVIGRATYYAPIGLSERIQFDFPLHAWVICEGEIIDGNVDSMVENPMVPTGVNPSSFWGKINEMPSDRILTNEKYVDETWEKNETEYAVLVRWRSEVFFKIKDI